MEKGFSKQLKQMILLALLGAIATGCVVSPQSASSSRDLTTVDNTPDSVSTGYGRVIQKNPVVLAGTSNIPLADNFAKYLDGHQVFISDDQFLRHDCRSGQSGALTNCISVLNQQSASPLQRTDKKWAFTVGTDEFLQVQGFYHIRKITEQFNDTLDFINGISQDPFNSYETSIPSNLFTANAHWFPDGTLTAFTNCDLLNNAYFDPSTQTLCFGTMNEASTAKFVYDPSVIYHETGHGLIQIMINMRSVADGNVIGLIDLGALDYDEAGAINEGLSDYFSYFVNSRKHISEWALGLFFESSRPMSEADSLHAAGISKDPDSRLSYPAFLNYDPNRHTQFFETVHDAGQITSHFLMAFTEELQSYCSMTESQAKNYVMLFINETLAENGDLSTKGTDTALEGRVNLNRDNAFDWAMKVNPLNYRTFFQLFAKYAHHSLVTNQRCNGSAYSKERLENLLDQYGLLLFDTYNENGNSVASGHTGTNTSITATNRILSTLVGKNNIMLDPTQNAFDAFIIDNRRTMVDIISRMKQAGQITSLTNLIPEDLPYNNDNVQISPGEVVGVALNLYNNSSTDMGGIQILANNWDHAKTTYDTVDTTKILKKEPCNNFDDQWPLSSEGGVGAESGAAGSCGYITQTNGGHVTGGLEDTGSDVPTDPLTPVCFVQKTDGDATTWVTQDEIKDEIGLPDKNCLAGSTGNYEDCFVRAIKGGDQATYSRIAAGKTWQETLTNGTETPSLSYSNMIFFEINPMTRPGLTFDCRMRVRFSNCKECYNDSSNGGDNYLDYKFSGDEPFKIIHFRFSVIN